MSTEDRIAKASAGAAIGAVVAFKTGKAGVLGAAVQAHPVVFGVCAAVVVGIIIYKVVKSKNKKQKKKEKKLTYSTGDDTTPRQHDVFYSDRDTKSVTNSAAPVSNDSDNNLRNRHVNGSTPSTTNRNPPENSSGRQSNTSNNLSEKSSEKKNILTEVKEVKTDLLDIHENDNERKVSPDENLPAMNLEEEVDGYFSRNIPVSDAETSESWSDDRSDLSDCSSWSNISPVKSADNSERKKYKKKVYRTFQKYVDKMAQENCTPLSTGNFDSLSSSSSSVSSSSKSETSSSPSECSSTSLESGSSSGHLLSEEPETCVACKQNPVNTRVQPCSHRYMCSDCALKFFELYKRCKICHAKIKKIVVED